MKTKTKIKAGALAYNHNEKLVRAKKVAIKSGVRAGISWSGGVGDARPASRTITVNHNEKLVRR